MSLLSISGITKRFGGVVANRDVSFEVAPGELVLVPAVLHDQELVDEKDGKEVLAMYRRIGIPLHHVLSRHIGRYSRPLILGGDNLLDRFLIRNITDLHQVEEMIEDYATECLKRIVAFVDKYHVEQKILD